MLPRVIERLFAFPYPFHSGRFGCLVVQGLARPPKEHELGLAGLLQDTVDSHLPISSEDSQLLYIAVKNVVDSNFGLKLRISNLSYPTPSKKFAVHINRIIDDTVESWTAETWCGKYTRFLDGQSPLCNMSVILASEALPHRNA